MLSIATRRATVAAVTFVVACFTAVAAGISAHGASQLQQRQIGVTTFSFFKVALIATRGSGHSYNATVTADGYQRSGGRWKLIAAKQIGKANGWGWFSVATCSLTVTEFKNNPGGSPPVSPFDSISVSLLITPAIGCSRTYSNHWPPPK